ncbi:prepilin peptidase [Candidatus Poriferisodalis sp.]|uniref:prepilin peptidase n=1 Tax=Candidatus Poriferisodalis sp. TaxID=3101277 RepID=UPI003B01F531
MTWASALVATAMTVWGAAAVALSIADLRTRLLPTKLIWPTAALVWVLYSGASLLRGEVDGLLGALAGALVGSAPVLLIHLLHPPSMGFGDVRFCVLNGLVCGWWGWHVALLGVTASFLAALPEAVVMMARQGIRASRPLGPYLALGTAAAAIWSAATSGFVP